MARPSSNPDKAKQGGGSAVEAGNYEVTNAEYQNIKTNFKATSPNLVFQCLTLDQSGERVRGADPVDINFSMGEKALEAFHPGQCSGPDDVEPKDMGDGVDAVGNTIYCKSDDQFNGSCGYTIFNQTLTKAGYPKALLEQTYAPNYVGLKFRLEHLKSDEVNKRFGTRLNTKPLPDGGLPTYKVCDKWLNPEMIGKGGGGKQSSAPVNGVVTPDAAATAEPPERMAEDVIKLLASTAATDGPKGGFKTPQSFVGYFSNTFISKAHKPPQMLSKCQDLVKRPDFLGRIIKENWLTGVDEEGQPKGLKLDPNGNVTEIEFPLKFA